VPANERERANAVGNRVKSYIVAVLLLASLSPVFPQEKGISYFVSAGKGVSPGGWGLRYAAAAGIESNSDRVFSVSACLNVLEYPFYNYGGLGHVVSHGTKSEISSAFLLKVAAPWPVAPYIAGGLGLAWIREGEVVMELLGGYTSVTPPRDGLVSFGCLKTGVEIYIFKKCAVGGHLVMALGSGLYTSNFSGQVGIRFWL
jgi:hypothetical protein